MKSNLLAVSLAVLVLSACSTTSKDTSSMYDSSSKGGQSNGGYEMSTMESMFGNNVSSRNASAEKNSGGGSAMNGASAASGASDAANSEAANSEAANLAALLQEMKSNSVYFDLNAYVIKPDYRDTIKKQSELIKSRANMVVTLEGNADERGSSEYNLALGDKRANAVRKPLELLGVPSGQIRTVSLGEANPRQTCHAEECWKENRRVDFIGQLN